VLIATAITKYLDDHHLGKVLGADGSLKILPGMVKIPDVSFISWDRWPKQPLPRRPIPALVPDLAIEVLSETNTPKEMDDKLMKYFQAGVRLVWHVDPETHTAKAFTGPMVVTEIGEGGVLDGGEVLPGFQLSLRELFERADQGRPEGV
jgi:Uma2 family endonuclease